MVNEYIKHGFNYAIANVLKTILPQYGFNQDKSSVDVSINDQTTEPIDFYFCESNNAGFREYGFKVDYNTKAPSGQNGYNGSKHIRKNNGVAIRLYGDTNDTLQIIVQDDLTALTKVAFTIQGHVVN